MNKKYIIAIALGSFMLFALYSFFNTYIETHSWEENKMSGYISEIRLYNHFPDNECYIRFDDGQYLVVDINHFFAYTILSQVSNDTYVTLIYERNGLNNVRLISVEVE